MERTDIDWIRGQIPAAGRMAYFNTGAEGPQPLAALTAQADVAQELATGGPATTECRRVVNRVGRDARGHFATLLGAEASEIALGHSTSHGIAVVAGAIDWKAGDEVLFDDLEHCSGIATWLHYAVRYGVKPVCIRTSGGNLDPEAVIAAMTDRTRLVCVSHVAYSTGAVLPVEAICAAARDRGILTVIDGAQSVGRIEVDVRTIGCDAYAAPGHKWLLGPPGTGALYVSPDGMARLSPAAVGWASLKNDDVSSLHYELHEDARRFELASLNGPMFAALNASIGFLQDIGWDVIHARSSMLVERLMNALNTVPSVSVLTPSQPTARAGLVSFTMPSGDTDGIVKKLYEEDAILVRTIAYPKSIRAALHVFNTEDEVDCLAAAVARILSS